MKIFRCGSYISSNFEFITFSLFDHFDEFFSLTSLAKIKKSSSICKASSYEQVILSKKFDLIKSILHFLTIRYCYYCLSLINAVDRSRVSSIWKIAKDAFLKNALEFKQHQIMHSMDGIQLRMYTCSCFITDNLLKNL